MAELTRLRQIRREKNLSGTFVANELGITPQYYYEIERGEKRLSADMAAELSRIFNVTTDYLLGRTDVHGYAIGGSRPRLTAEDYADGYDDELTEDEEAWETFRDLIKRVCEGPMRSPRFIPGVLEQIEDDLNHIREIYNVDFENTPGNILGICHGESKGFIEEFISVFGNIDIGKLMDAKSKSTQERMFDIIARAHELPEEDQEKIAEGIDALVSYHLNKQKKTDK